MPAIEFGSTSLRSDPNLQAYYKLENVNDDLGVNNLTNNGSVTFGACKFNNGADLGTGLNKNLRLTNALNYANGVYGVSIWGKFNAAPANNTSMDIVHIYGSQSQFLMQYQQISGVKQLQMTRYRGAAGQEDLNYTVDLGTTIIHNYMWTWDGTNIIIWLDGVQVGSMASSATTNGSNTPGMVIGGQPNDSTANSAAAIFDDAAFFNRGLTQADVNIVNGITIPKGLLGLGQLSN